MIDAGKSMSLLPFQRHASRIVYDKFMAGSVFENVQHFHR